MKLHQISKKKHDRQFKTDKLDFFVSSNVQTNGFGCQTATTLQVATAKACFSGWQFRHQSK